MRLYFISLILLLLYSCKPSTEVEAPSAFESIVNSDAPSALEAINQTKFCESFDITLNGAFWDGFSDGKMTWSGGVEGTVEISGVDYNEMTCTYKVTNCALGQISMVCNQSAYDTTMDLYTADSIKLGTTVYTRVR